MRLWFHISIISVKYSSRTKNRFDTIKPAIRIFWKEERKFWVSFYLYMLFEYLLQFFLMEARFLRFFMWGATLWTMNSCRSQVKLSSGQGPRFFTMILKRQLIHFADPSRRTTKGNTCIDHKNSWTTMFEPKIFLRLKKSKFLKN